MITRLIFEIDDEHDGHRFDKEKMERIIKVDDLCSVLWELLEGPQTPREVSAYVRELLGEEGIDLYSIWS